MMGPMETRPPRPVVPVGSAQDEDTIAVLTEAFADDATLRYVVGDAAVTREPHVRALAGFFVQARRLRDEPVLGVVDGSGLVGAALVSFPWAESPETLAGHREALWRELGEDARKRYEAIGRVAASFEVGRPHLHLNLLGVRRAHQGAGIGRRLVDEVQRLSRDHPLSEGVDLVTSGEKNLRFYRKLGFGVIGDAEVAPGLVVSVLFRGDENG